MRYISLDSNIFEGCLNIIFYAEDRREKRGNAFMRRNRKDIIKYLNSNGAFGFDIRILRRNRFGMRSLRNLILRNEPTMTSQQLEERLKAHRNGNNNACSWRLFCVTDIKYMTGSDCRAEILVCNPTAEEPEKGIRMFLDELIAKWRRQYEAMRLDAATDGEDSGIRYRLPDDEEKEEHDFATNEQIESNRSILETELLAEYIHPRKPIDLSPLIIDEDFNISLPLYPRIKIELSPFPMAIYILFLRHPEGILLKEFATYREELKRIYCKISGRRNNYIINKLIDRACTPIDNLLHKNMSIIRSAFTKRLRADIAKFYIPNTGRLRPLNIPIDRNLIQIKGLNIATNEDDCIETDDENIQKE